MPSEAAAVTDRMEVVLQALEPRVDTFRSAVVTAAEDVRAFVHHRRGVSSYRAEQALMELGPFAIGRIDPERFGQLMLDTEPLAPEVEQVLDEAESVLERFAHDDTPFTAEVPPGGDLRDTVKDALAELGRVYAAARVIELARGGAFDRQRHGHLLGPFPFRHWNRAERQLAPPLVVRVRGEDCLPAGLGEFLDGTLAIVLMVEGPTTPAPLARLITPGTFVLQTADPGELEALGASPHPAIALLFDEDREAQALFVHDPDAGATPAQRLTIHRLPEAPQVGRGRRPPAWLEELAHLKALASTTAPAAPSLGPLPEAVPGEAEGDGAPPGPEVTVDRLAAWLLSQTDLKDL